jgi:hypothetical protein
VSGALGGNAEYALPHLWQAVPFVFVVTHQAVLLPERLRIKEE